MNEKISDERLRELKSLIKKLVATEHALGMPLNDKDMLVQRDAYFAIDELLSLRSLNKRLVADGERLAKKLTSWCEVYQLWSLDYDDLEAHAALMKEIGG